MLFQLSQEREEWRDLLEHDLVYVPNIQYEIVLTHVKQEVDVYFLISVIVFSAYLPAYFLIRME